MHAHTCPDDTNHVWLNGRKVAPGAYHRQGSFLSWSGFEAVCQDFSIVTTTTIALGAMTRANIAAAAGSVSPHQPPLTNHHHHNSSSNDTNNNFNRHQSSRGSLPSDPKRPPRTSLTSPAVKATRRPDSPATASRRILSTRMSSGGLLSEVQACIAFVSACTHGSAVASFPNDDGRGGSGNSAPRGGTVKRVPYQLPRGGRAEEGEERINDNQDEAYWRVSLLLVYTPQRGSVRYGGRRANVRVVCLE